VRYEKRDPALLKTGTRNTLIFALDRISRKLRYHRYTDRNCDGIIWLIKIFYTSVVPARTVQKYEDFDVLRYVQCLHHLNGEVSIQIPLHESTPLAYI